MHSEGVVVEFRLGNNQTWVGNFQPGQHGGNGYSAVTAHPDGHHVLVVAGGQGYVVDPLSRKCAHFLGEEIRAMIGVPSMQMVILWERCSCASGDDFIAVGFSGMLWDSRVNFGEEASHVYEKSLRVEGAQLTGWLRSCYGDVGFKVNLGSGEVKYGEILDAEGIGIDATTALPEPGGEVPIRQVRWVGTTAIIDLRQTQGKPDSSCIVLAVSAAIREGAARIVVNLEEVSYLYDTMLSGLIGGKQRARDKKVALCLCCLSENAEALLKITRCDTVFEVFATEEDALAWIGPAEQ
jgi:anti-anti-sigma factor